MEGNHRHYFWGCCEILTTSEEFLMIPILMGWLLAGSHCLSLRGHKSVQNGVCQSDGVAGYDLVTTRVLCFESGYNLVTTRVLCLSLNQDFLLKGLQRGGTAVMARQSLGSGTESLLAAAQGGCHGWNCWERWSHLLWVTSVLLHYVKFSLCPAVFIIYTLCPGCTPDT
jgi:hypothetical protein